MASNWGLSVMQGIYNIANFIVDLTPIGTVKSAYNCYQAIKREDTEEAIREGFSVAIDVALFFTGGKILKKAEKVLTKGTKALKNIVKARKAASRTAKLVKEGTKLAEAANKLRKLAGKAGEKIAGAGKFVSSKLHRSKTVSRSEQPRPQAMELDLQLFAESKSGKETYYFRGTTEGYPGNSALQRLGITPTSTDPLVSTVFATNGEQYGKGVLYIASSSDLKGISSTSSNVLSSYNLSES